MNKLESLKSILEENCAAVVSTIDENGNPDARMMDFAPSIDGEVPGLFMFTFTGAKKMQQFQNNRNVTLTIGKEFTTPAEFMQMKIAKVTGTVRLSSDYDEETSNKKRKFAVDKVVERLPFLAEAVVKGSYENLTGIFIEIENIEFYDNGTFGPQNLQTLSKAELKA